MKQLPLDRLAMLLVHVNEACATFFMTSQGLGKEAVRSGYGTQRSRLAICLRDLEEVFRELGFRGLRDQVGRLAGRVGTDATETELYWGCLTLLQNVGDELTGHLFFHVPWGQKELYLEPVQWFGQPAVDQFPQVERDVRDACRCLALRQPTATVFHAMRVIEPALWWLAEQVEITDAQTRNQGDLIPDIQRRINAIENEKRTPERDGRLQQFSEAATEFQHFKNAWRNDVMHSKEFYGEQEAERILRSVRDFVRVLAEVRSRMTEPPPR